MSLAYERYGTGPPLVLLHGVGHRRQAWDAVLDLLTPHRTVITVDLPGHGESPPLRLDGRPPVAVIAEEIFAFFDEMRLDRPHVAGNSLGGALALVAGARGRAATVTGLSPAGFWARNWEYAYAKGVFAAGQLLGSAVRPVIPAMTRRTLGRAVLVGGFVARPSRMPAAQAAADALAFLRARDTVRVILAESVSFTGSILGDVPVTIAWGTKDRVLHPRQARVAMRHLPHAGFVPLPGCGHVPMTDDPALVAKVILGGSALA